MSIELADKNGPLGQAATNTGFGEARGEVETSKTKELKKLFIDGVTKDPKTASKEAYELAHDRSIKKNAIRTTLLNISDLLSKAEEFAVVET
jgi:hypothetical protein